MIDVLDAVAIAASLVWLVSVLRLGVLNEWHHWFVGAWCFIGGRVYDSPLVMALGALVMLDDAYQHLRQCLEPEYRSPLWKLYAFLYPVLPKWMRL